MQRHAKKLIALLLVISFTFSVSLAQENHDPESEYQQIRSLAFRGNYAEAETASRNLLKRVPAYGDTRILLGRILAWQKRYDEALAAIDTLLATEPENSDAIEARKEISTWQWDNSPVKTEINTGYSFDRFKLPYDYSFQIVTAGATHRFKFGKGTFNLNFGRHITGGDLPSSKNELQLEASIWPRFSAHNYAYLDYAFSNGSFFPSHRFAAEFWQILPARWSVSAGVNYYFFTSGIPIADFSVEKYLGKFWFSGKEYVYFKKGGAATAFYFNSRWYFTDADYLQLTLGAGAAPDEPYDLTTDLNRQSAYSIRIAYRFTAARDFSLKINAGYSREEYSTGTWRNRFEGGVSMIYSIRSK